MVLAIDTASETAAVAIAEKTNVIAEYCVLSEKSHSKAILPMIEEMFKRAGRNVSDIDYIVCCAGPGSFTGLRIGAAVAKSMAFTLGKKIVPVSSLDALAYNVLIEGYVLCPMIDARGNHVYTAFYRYEHGKLLRLTEYMTVPVSEALVHSSKYGAPCYFTGNGAKKYSEMLNTEGSLIAPAHMNMLRASVLGVYAYEYSNAINAVSGTEFTPVYMSRGQAEASNG